MAGFGTRRLPITKAIEKCMLPVGNRPVIDYIVEDCLRAGITEFMFVVGEEFDQLKRYYGQNPILEEYLESVGKTQELAEIRSLTNKARFHYVVQDQYQPRGTSVPLWLCRHLIRPDEKFLYVSGDQFYYREDGSSEFADFVEQANGAGTPSAMMAVEVPWDQVEKYGIVATKQRDGLDLMDRIIEKPSRDQAPTNLNNAMVWMFDYGIFKFADENLEQTFDHEYYITDIATAYVAAGNDIAVVRAKGEYLDCGTTDTWLYANQRLLGQK